MDLFAFHTCFPDVAQLETRSINLLVPKYEIPAGDYGFVEFYCADPKCDCQRVVLEVLRRDGMKFVASISHAFRPPKPGDRIQEQTILDPLNPNAPYAPGLLRVFLETVLDDAYAQRLRRHYSMVKQHAINAAATGMRKASGSKPRALKAAWKRLPR